MTERIDMGKVAYEAYRESWYRHVAAHPELGDPKVSAGDWETALPAVQMLWREMADAIVHEVFAVHV